MTVIAGLDASYHGMSAICFIYIALSYMLFFYSSNDMSISGVENSAYDDGNSGFDGNNINEGADHIQNDAMVQDADKVMPYTKKDREFAVLVTPQLRMMG